MNNFAKIFLSLRNTKGLNQEQMAKELGVSKSTIGMWEIGKRLPSPEMFEQIADYFNIDIDYLYGRTTIMRKSMFDEYGQEYSPSVQPSIYQQRLQDIIDETKLEVIEQMTPVIEELVKVDSISQNEIIQRVLNQVKFEVSLKTGVPQEVLEIKMPSDEETVTQEKLADNFPSEDELFGSHSAPNLKCGS